MKKISLAILVICLISISAFAGTSGLTNEVNKQSQPGLVGDSTLQAKSAKFNDATVTWADATETRLDATDSAVTASVVSNLTGTLITSNLTANGDAAVAGDLTITGSITASGTNYVGNLEVSGDLTVSGNDIDSGAAAMTIGKSAATKVEIADTAVETDIQGTLSVDEAAVFDATVGVTGVLTGSAAVYGTTIGFAATTGYFEIADTTQLVFVAESGATTNVIDADITTP